MTGTTELRAAITGLIGLAAAQRGMLLAQHARRRGRQPGLLGHHPLVAHNAEFRRQQVVRLRAVRSRPMRRRFGRSPTTGHPRPTGATALGPRLR